jgi:hypothetical protein
MSTSMEFEQFSHLLVRRNLLKAHVGLPTFIVMCDEGLRLDFDACRGLVDSVLGDAICRHSLKFYCKRLQESSSPSWRKTSSFTSPEKRLANYHFTSVTMAQ